ncbi:hypothetical protein RRF57_008493 [Xylaria bambusicola]|uniref:Uncharacterized protein n=1 Tax=Xylaria bambusicola TaxID=326684 RepID=A0AAN7V1T4_9PEZI
MGPASRRNTMRSTATEAMVSTMTAGPSHDILRQAGKLVQCLVDLIETVHNTGEVIPELLGVVHAPRCT